MNTKKQLKIVFAGTPDIAQVVLQHILNNGFKVDLVLTKPDSRQGRGNKVAYSPVKQLALNYNIPLLQPQSFKLNPEIVTQIQQLCPDIIIVVAYGLIFPKALLTTPRLGCVNIHVSLLPQHRGAAPINRAIIAGDAASGVTVMQMDAGLDTGDILLQQQIVLAANETAGTLHDKLAMLGSKMIIDYLEHYAEIKPTPQSGDGVSYAHKIDKSEAKINWQEDARVIERKIRGFNPAPGCFSYLDDKLIKVWRASIGDAGSNAMPGTIIAAHNDTFSVCCGNGSTLLLEEVQEAGKTKQLARDYLRGHMNLQGAIFS